MRQVHLISHAVAYGNDIGVMHRLYKKQGDEPRLCKHFKVTSQVFLKVRVGTHATNQLPFQRKPSNGGPDF